MRNASWRFPPYVLITMSLLVSHLSCYQSAYSFLATFPPLFLENPVIVAVPRFNTAYSSYCGYRRCRMDSIDYITAIVIIKLMNQVHWLQAALQRCAKIDLRPMKLVHQSWPEQRCSRIKGMNNESHIGGGKQRTNSDFWAYPVSEQCLTTWSILDVRLVRVRITPFFRPITPRMSWLPQRRCRRRQIKQRRHRYIRQSSFCFVREDLWKHTAVAYSFSRAFDNTNPSECTMVRSRTTGNLRYSVAG